MIQKKYILPILLVVQIIVMKTLGFFPEFVETFYSNGIYVWISAFSRTVLGSIPFSVGDVMYFVLTAYLIRKIWKSRKTFRSEWKDNILSVLSFFSVFYFFFHLLWATNYHRENLSDKMNIETDYSDEDLLAFTKKLILKTNALHSQIVKNDSSKVTFPYSQDEIFKMTLSGYDNLAQQYPFFTYKHPSIKKSIISLPLTYMGFAGYLNPFTNEAQVNDKLPMYSFPLTTNHEMAHQIGYASESEANFIGFLASIHNDDLYIRYSGYAFALRYCLGNWEIRNEKILEELLPTVNPGIRKNFKESRDFWAQYETFIEEGFKVFYDKFLKLNQQKDGLDSYSKFVNLIVNYEKSSGKILNP